MLKLADKEVKIVITVFPMFNEFSKDMENIERKMEITFKKFPNLMLKL